MSADEDLMAALATQLDRDERTATAAAQDGALREVTAKRAVLAEHLPIESDYGLTCKRCVSWQDDEGQHEFGIAIPEPWPCLPVAAIAASNEQNLALAADVLTAGRAVTQAEFLATLPDRMQAIADQLSMLLPDGLRLAWAPRSPSDRTTGVSEQEADDATMTTISVGDRVQVKPQYDDTLHVLGMRTTAGTVSAIYQDDDAIIVDLDSGQGVPYRPEELDILGIELPEATQ